MWSEPSLSLISGWGATLGLCSMLNSSFQLTILFATTSNKYHQITCLCQANSFSSSRKSCLMLLLLLLMCKEEKTKVSKTTFLHNELYLANPIPPLCALKSKKVLPTMYLCIQFWEVPNKCNLFQISGFCYDVRVLSSAPTVKGSRIILCNAGELFQKNIDF